jgi:hypothetical protein
VDLHLESHYSELVAVEESEGDWISDDQIIPLAPCTPDRITSRDSISQVVNISDGFICPDVKNLTLKGSSEATIMMNYWLILDRCSEESLE